MLEVYREFVETELAIPVYAGKKSDSERFAGAQDTYAIEALMKDGKALQAGTSHHLGQHFAKVFDITYQDEQGKRQHVWQTSWGVSTRLVGAIVMTHGDDQGLRLPPNVAPIQAVVVPIWRKDEDRAARDASSSAKVKQAVGGIVRLHVDDRDQYTPGWKYNEYEMRGVPVRLEIGPKDVANNAVMSVRRDTRGKESIPFAQLAERLPALLADIQRSLFEQAKTFRDENTVLAASKEEVIAHFAAEKRGFVAVAWDGTAAFEAEIKEALRRDAALHAVRPLPLRFAREGRATGSRSSHGRTERRARAGVTPALRRWRGACWSACRTGWATRSWRGRSWPRCAARPARAHHGGGAAGAAGTARGRRRVGRRGRVAAVARARSRR